MYRTSVNTIDRDAETITGPSYKRQRVLRSDGTVVTIESEEAEATREASLVASAQRGNAPAFEELIRPLRKTILRFGLHITGRPEDADEVLQESLFKAWKNLLRFRGGSRFSTWVVRIAINEALMNLRKRNSNRFIPIEDGVDDEGGIRPWNWHDQRPNPEQLLIEAEVRSLLLGAAQTLSPHYRKVFLLRYGEGLSIRETAIALKLSSPTVKSRANRACHHVRHELGRTLKIRDMRSDTTSHTHSVGMGA